MLSFAQLLRRVRAMQTVSRRMEARLRMLARIILPLAFAVCVSASAGDGVLRVSPQDRTAALPDSWLVIYNLDMPDSVTWATWYAEQRDIPAENLVGVHASLAEHLTDLSDVQTQVVLPICDLLANNPDIESKIMGILVGYGVPGSYYVSPAGGPGGFSVGDAVEQMTDDALPPEEQRGYNNVDNPQFLGNLLPPGGRLTKATMDSGRYMVARIDGPTLAEAKALTLRAKVIEDDNHYIHGEYVWYDYHDSAFPAGEWHWLKFALEEPLLDNIPWMEFDADTEQTPNDAFRFGAHDVNCWNDDRLYHPDAGSRILAFNYNSWGATTVRSITAEGGRYVPNALAAGYAAAIGSTAEPQCCTGPIPETLLAGLREGWTLGESFHICAVYDDWMWTLFGDPFLTIPHWFDEEPPVHDPGDGDMNRDGVVNGLDVELFGKVFSGQVVESELRAIADLTGDGRLDDDDMFLFFGPALHGSYNAIVLSGGGDANGDGVVDGLDIPVFVDRLLRGPNGTESLRARISPDMNGDGEITIADVPGFVDALLRRPVVGSGQDPPHRSDHF